jgi:tartrate dehydratase alpha subunit/fumarate hydratase class I-like protein
LTGGGIEMKRKMIERRKESSLKAQMMEVTHKKLGKKRCPTRLVKVWVADTKDKTRKLVKLTHRNRHRQKVETAVTRRMEKYMGGMSLNLAPAIKIERRQS